MTSAISQSAFEPTKEQEKTCLFPPISRHRRIASEALFGQPHKQVIVPLFPRSPFGKHGAYNHTRLHFESMREDQVLIRHAKERNGRHILGASNDVIDSGSDTSDESEKLRDLSQLKRERMKSLMELGDLLYGPHRAIKIKHRTKRTL